MTDNITYKIVTQVPTDEALELYIEAGWWTDEWPADGIPDLVAGSFKFAAAFNESGKLIGTARAISDGVSDAYIQDVVVASAYRKQGIGSYLIRMLIDELQAAGVDWIGLIGKPGTAKFYESLGFSELKDYIPMKLS